MRCHAEESWALFVSEAELLSVLVTHNPRLAWIDYSCVYVVLKANGFQHEGHGLTFSLGRGNEVSHALGSLALM